MKLNCREVRDRYGLDSQIKMIENYNFDGHRLMQIPSKSQLSRSGTQTLTQTLKKQQISKKSSKTKILASKPDSGTRSVKSKKQMLLNMLQFKKLTLEDSLVIQSLLLSTSPKASKPSSKPKLSLEKQLPQQPTFDINPNILQLESEHSKKAEKLKVMKLGKSESDLWTPKVDGATPKQDTQSPLYRNQYLLTKKQTEGIVSQSRRVSGMKLVGDDTTERHPNDSKSDSVIVEAEDEGQKLAENGIQTTFFNN